VEYREGKLNGAVDALSHREEDTATVHAISSPTFELFDKLRDEIQHSPETTVVRFRMAKGKADKGWSLADDLALSGENVFQKSPRCGQSCCPMPTLVMKGFRKPSRGDGRPSIALRPFGGFASLCGDAQFAKRTSLNTSIQQICCNPSQFHLRFGVTF
jgi:hypothetical protein